MSRISAAWIIITMACCAVLVTSRLAEMDELAAGAKCLASASFLMLALTAGIRRHAAGRIALAGLVFAAAGDVFLLGNSQRFFLIGLSSFLLAHLFYIAAFLMLGADRRWSAVAAGPLIALSLGVSAWLSPYVGSGMRLAVIAYTVVITVMVIAAYGVRGATGSALIPAGATLFYLSDLSVAAGQFVQTDFPNYVWGLPLYYSGQVLLALGVARLGRGDGAAAA